MTSNTLHEKLNTLADEAERAPFHLKPALIARLVEDIIAAVVENRRRIEVLEKQGV